MVAEVVRSATQRWNNVGASNALSFASLPAAGNAVVVCCVDWAGGGKGTETCTDNQGNSYQRVAVQEDGTRIRVSVWIAENIGTPSGTFTVTHGGSSPGSTYGCLTISEVSGLSNGSYDVAAGTLVSSSTWSATCSVGPTSSTARADEIAFAAIGYDSWVAPAGMALPSGYTNLFDEEDGVHYLPARVDYKVLSAAAAQSVSWGSLVDPGGGTGRWGAVLVTFKASMAGSAAVAPPRLPPRIRIGAVTNAYDEGNDFAVTTLPVATQPSGSCLVAFCTTGGIRTIYGFSDSYGNTWQQTFHLLGVRHTQVYVCSNAKGGPGHTFTFSVDGGGQQIDFVELLDAELVGALGEAAGQSSSSTPFVSPSISTGRNESLLLGFIASNSADVAATNEVSGSFPAAGWKIVDRREDADWAWGAAIAACEVTRPGSYSVGFTQVGATEANISILAFRPRPRGSLLSRLRPVWLGPRFVQSAHATSDVAATSIVVNLTNVQEGNTLAVFGFCYRFANLTVTDDKGNTYTTVDSVSSGDERYRSFYTVVGAGKGGSLAITLNLDQSRGYQRVFVAEYAGLGALDKNAAQNYASWGATTDAATSGTQTTTVDGCLIIGLYGQTSDQTLPAAGTSFTQRDTLQNAAGDAWMLEDRVQSAAGSVAATFTPGSANRNTTVFMLAFKPAGGVSAPQVYSKVADDPFDGYDDVLFSLVVPETGEVWLAPGVQRRYVVH